MMNLYRPPGARVDDRVDPTLVKPRVLPRDVTDILLIVFIALPFQLFPLFGVPTLLVYWLSDSLDLAFLTFVLVYVLLMLFTVWSVRVGTKGIEFRRLIGKPKFLPWNDVLSIRLGTRTEVVRDGWLWPLFPARETTVCLSTRDHVRFEGPFGFCFFPPKDAQQFLRLVARFRDEQIA